MGSRRRALLARSARPVTARRWHTYPRLAGREAIWLNGNTRDVVPHPMGAADWIGWRRMADLLLELVGSVLPDERHALFSAIMAGGEPGVTARQAYYP